MNATKTVPTYLIIGSGRVARHVAHYFHLLNLKYQTWDRSEDISALAGKVSACSHILLAISDSSLESFYQEHLAKHEDKTLVHFSGALYFKGMIAAHPLMTFGPDLYDLSTYQQIHFALTGCDSLDEALPGLSNPYSNIFAFEKARYHALCVLGGNFTTLLLAKMLEGFAEMKIPQSAAKPYIERVIQNTLANPGDAFTGPLARKDAATVEKNLQALKDDPYQAVYKAFLETLWPEYPRK
ncbi:DUF2520 domain-containing protein [Bdellovibrio bacteriovorus]|uniref:DUF2520 domain-containing protein n=1 Tax=Bdellovibrio bacteriovorus TaxID=959 RepID=UPI0003217980|nr:DUF2520 domain-containing protein [Bdellovibrio bacteriovorus]BEV69886.1 hypothetical protein Bb109J_c3306 [Bdellovibrio bacteriovorus]